ncbi:hypothetical protein ACFVH9_08610 [Streptomyces hirsutus]|uniref:hypothetical protein n=1 Tax=Streptomyces hirsutus TaxID=35620 RepID=UPI0036414DBC
MKTKTFAVAAALAILLAAACCQHQDDGSAPVESCDGIAYAAPAGPVERTKTPSSRKNPDPPARATKEPRPSAPPSRRPVDIDLELDGC